MYLNRKGTIDDGSGPIPYIYWTPYFSGAQGFDSRKTAEAMMRELAKEGVEVTIVTEMQKGGKFNGKAGRRD